jgi:hypothetical protein
MLGFMVPSHVSPLIEVRHSELIDASADEKKVKHDLREKKKVALDVFRNDAGRWHLNGRKTLRRGVVKKHYTCGSRRGCPAKRYVVFTKSRCKECDIIDVTYAYAHDCVDAKTSRE